MPTVCEQAPQFGQHRPQLLVDGVRVQPVGDDDLHVWPSRRVQRCERSSILLAQSFTSRWMGQIVIATRGSRALTYGTRSRRRDDVLVDGRVQRGARIRIERVES